MTFFNRLRLPVSRARFSISPARRYRDRSQSGEDHVPAWVEVLEDRILLAAPTVVNPIDDVVVSRDQTERVAAGLESPLYVTAPENDFDRLFIVERTGQIRILDLDTREVLATPFLDLPDGNLSTGGERGLLGLAFHPDYAVNGEFFVNFTDAAGNTVIARYEVSGNDPNLADPTSADVIFTLDQPFSNHNGGWMGFGPDGFLYISSGDGGSANDPDNRAQNLNDLHGKILRIDVDGDDFSGDDRDYAIPADNPFVGVEGSDEIWAFGLRNPWRPSFDADTEDFYIADVGQNAREEVNFQRADSPGGENYGWRPREGTIATPGVNEPTPLGAVDPVYDYEQGDGPFQGQSVTGGYVYRGPVEDLRGQYIFGDFISSQIWSIQVDRDAGAMVPGSLADLTQQFTPDAGSIGLISSFGEDAAGNLYVVDFGGEIFRVVPRFSDTYAIDLSQRFSDPENDDTYTVETNSNPDSVTAEVMGDALRLSFDRAIRGDVEITVRATDPGTGDSVTDTFLVSFEVPSLVAVGADAGGGPHVRVFETDTQTEWLSFFAYDPGFTGGVRVAAGDVSGDGVPDIITAAGPGGGPHVRVFDGSTGQQLPGPIGSFFAYDPGFTGGVFVAAADWNDDGIADILTGADSGGGPHVKVFDGADGGILQSFFAYDPAFTGGVRVAAGDVSGDGIPDIITGAGPGGGPHVRVFDGQTGQPLSGSIGSFFAYDAGFAGGVYVSAELLDGDDLAEIVTGAGAGGGPHVRIFRGSDGAELNGFFAFAADFTGGVRVGTNQFNQAGRPEVFVAAGPGEEPRVRIFDGLELSQGATPAEAETANFNGFVPGFAGGIFAAGTSPGVESSMEETLASLFAEPGDLLDSLE